MLNVSSAAILCNKTHSKYNHNTTKPQTREKTHKPRTTQTNENIKISINTNTKLNNLNTLKTNTAEAVHLSFSTNTCSQLTVELFHPFHQIQYINQSQTSPTMILNFCHLWCVWWLLSHQSIIFVYICVKGKENRYNAIHTSSDGVGE